MRTQSVCPSNIKFDYIMKERLNQWGVDIFEKLL
jgi:hypothetical protein